MGNLTVSELHKALPRGNYLDWLVVDDVLHHILVDAKHLTKPIRHLRVRMQLEDHLIDRLPQPPLFIHSAYDANKVNCMLYLFRRAAASAAWSCPPTPPRGELGTFTKLLANVISRHFVEINVRRPGKPETRHQSNWRYYYTDDGEGGKVVCRLPQGMYGAFVDEIRDKRVYYRRDKDVLQPLWPEAESMNVAVRGLREKVGNVVEGEEAWLRALFALMHPGTGPLGVRTLMVLMVLSTLDTGNPALNGSVCMGLLLEDEASRDQESSPGTPSRSPELDRHFEDDLHSEPEIPPTPVPTRGTRDLHAREPHPSTNKPTHGRIFIPPWTIPQIPPPPQPQPTITPALGDRDPPPAKPSSSRST
ncbi:hypothetical protein ASPACDRAFT_38223 [Aspergillus aculeatus ATCC 16872]|uniref:Uncharacterized protein n=1 Tax=Aspergillus aculeatus (strain ATCC 16872 / CBS 172.66 / WB 5094) TaxID=690307 RepID=A0A1L9X892_ASPA1|nr:uncharacterized protein ASPACDRAFT_38223 [Aspergillus aculeatus ATCC 16872]OJK04661.1 hypothetical protein ASPACDRAFT_38223 [Aspergillus aculeatus ATCC 16872]